MMKAHVAHHENDSGIIKKKKTAEFLCKHLRKIHREVPGFYPNQIRAKRIPENFNVTGERFERFSDSSKAHHMQRLSFFRWSFWDAKPKTPRFDGETWWLTLRRIHG